MTETKSVIVYGAGVSGRGAAEVLAKHGRQVFLYNDTECKIEDSLAQALAANGGELVCGNFAKLLGSAELLVLSPGVPCDNENVLLAEEKGVEVISEVELAYRNYGGHIAAITGTNGKTLRMNNSSLYGYVQVQGKWQKLSYVLGMGIQRQAFSEVENNFSYVSFRPSVSLSYPVFKNAQLRYTFNITPYIPSLSQLSDIVQQSNNLEINRGNRYLRPYRVYSNRLTFSWNTNPVNVQLTGNYNYYDKPILTSIHPVLGELGNYLLEYASVNGKAHHSANARLNVQWKIIPDFLAINAYGGVNWYRSKGEDFDNEYKAWILGATMSANYKKFSLVAGASTRPKSLYGYYVNYGEKDSYVQLTYILNKNFFDSICWINKLTY